MEKMKMETLDIIQGNIEKIGALFPNVLTETKDENGKIIKAINFDKLRQELLDDIIDDRDESYDFTWVGKNQAVVDANTPIRKTLRPVVDDEKVATGSDSTGKTYKSTGSKNFDTTENLYIEGDNLDVLKMLQESYLNSIKMIYIDPPYNTGKDSFVYPDNYAMDKDDYEEQVEYRNDDDEIMFEQNNDSNPRFHSDWCSMIYARLKLAKNLLTDDGVIFISIDDNEVENLKKIGNEIFGESNFVASLIWNTDGHTDNQYEIKINHEYILVFVKNKKSLQIGWVVDKNTRAESNLWKGFAENSITKNGPANPASKITLFKGFPCEIKQLYLPSNKPIQEFWNELEKTGYITRQMTERFNVTYPIRLTDMIVEDGKLKNDVELFTGWGNANKLKQYNSTLTPLCESDGDVTFFLSKNGVVYYNKKRTKARNIVSVLQNLGTTEKTRSDLEKNEVFFSYPKPEELLQYIIKVGNLQNDDTILDFFSGSATTAHAVMQLNAEDGGKRKFICVQLPEVTDDKSEAFKAGYDNICEIGKERIRRAGEKILNENPDCKDLDVGFRVLKVDSTNMKDVYYGAGELTQSSLADMISNIKEDRSGLDLLYGVLLDWSLKLSYKCETLDIDGLTVYNYDNGSLVACLEDKKVSESVIREIAKMKPMRVVFRDNSFKDSADKINLEEIFKLITPETSIKVI